MVVIFHFQDTGFCKYKRRCKFKHYQEEVCREVGCRNTDCWKRHPKPCRNFFIKKFCRFGQECKYDHEYSCEACDNLKFLIDKETHKFVDSVTIDKLRQELSEAKKEVVVLKKEKNSIVQELNSLRSDKLKTDCDYKKVKTVKSALKEENRKLKLATISAENNLKHEKKALEKVIEKVTTTEKENNSLNSALKVTENELNVIKIELKNLRETENKAMKRSSENSYDKSMKESYEGQLRIKDMEIKSLISTRRVCVENASKLLKTNQKLENEIKDLKVNNKVPCKENEKPYPCDKCDSTFKTASLLVKHVTREHEYLPFSRPL